MSPAAMPDESHPRRRFHVPSGLPLPRRRLGSEALQDAFEGAESRPTDPEGHTEDAPPELQTDELPTTQTDPAAARAASGLTILLFGISFLGSLTFCAAYLWIPFHHDYGLQQNLAMGSGLGVALLGLALGMLSLAKTSSPPVKSVQEREPHHAPEEDQIAAEEQVIKGFRETTLAKRKLARRMMLLAIGALPLPFLFGLRDLGPRPRSSLRRNSWERDERMVDPDTLEPLKAEDLEVGGMATVMPENDHDPELPINAESVVVVIRLPPGVNRPLPGRSDWVVNDLAGTVVAYSKVCTHAGCPVGLYEQKTHLLLCPCHQSTFDVPTGCQVIFGPAARPLPQLPIYTDEEGYLRARRSFDQPLGPSFWERNGDPRSHHI